MNLLIRNNADVYFFLIDWAPPAARQFTLFYLSIANNRIISLIIFFYFNQNHPSCKLRLSTAQGPPRSSVRKDLRRSSAVRICLISVMAVRILMPISSVWQQISKWRLPVKCFSCYFVSNFKHLCVLVSVDFLLAADGEDKQGHRPHQTKDYPVASNSATNQNK